MTINIVDQCVKELQLKDQKSEEDLNRQLEEAVAAMSPEGQARIREMQDKLVAMMHEKSEARRGRKPNFGREAALRVIFAIAKIGSFGTLKESGLLSTGGRDVDRISAQPSMGLGCDARQICPEPYDRCLNAGAAHLPYQTRRK